MVVDSILPHAEFGPDDHREDALRLSLRIHRDDRTDTLGEQWITEAAGANQ